MVTTDQPSNQKVTLSSETIKLLNEQGEGLAYDDIIQKALANAPKNNKEAKAEPTVTKHPSNK